MQHHKSCFFAIIFAFLVISSPSWAETDLPFGKVTEGTLSSAGQVNSYTFNGSVGDVFVFTMVTTNGYLVPAITLYNPDGTINSSNYAGYPYACGGTVVYLDPAPFKETGEYTLDVADCNSTNTGGYNLYVQNVKDPVGASNLPLGQVTAGSIKLSAQDNTYTFHASAGDVLLFDMVRTSNNLIPAITLYNPDGTFNSSNYAGYPYACGGTLVNLAPKPLKQTGEYTLFVEDCTSTNTGNYNLYFERVQNPVGAVDLLWSQVQPGSISAAAQYNTYTFEGSPGDVVNFLKIVTTSGNLVPAISLYNPDGSFNSSNYAGYPYACGGTVVNLVPKPLEKSGEYTVFVGDCSATNTGTYNLNSQCSVGPCTVPTPVISTISPKSIDAGGPSFTFMVMGANFLDTSMVEWNGSPLKTTFVSSMKLMATVPAADIAKPGIAEITVKDPDGQTSNSQPFTVQGTPAEPVFSPPPGTYSPHQSVTISDTTPGTKIYCTIGSTPATTPTPAPIPADLCKLPISVTATETIKAIAAIGSYASPPVTASYIIETAAPPPIFSPAGRTYDEAQSVTLSDSDPGAVFYYTTNGATPTPKPAEKYTGPIFVYTTETIKAIAVVPGHTDSPVAEVTYKIIGSPFALAAPPAAIGTTTATLRGVVNTGGLTGSFFFRYGTSCTSLNHVTKTTSLPASGADFVGDVPVTGLLSKTQYCYSVTVTTAAGSATGADISFMTK